MSDCTTIGGTIDCDGNITRVFISGNDVAENFKLAKQVIKIIDPHVSAEKVMTEVNSKGSTTKNFITYNVKKTENFALLSLE